MDRCFGKRSRVIVGTDNGFGLFRSYSGQLEDKEIADKLEKSKNSREKILMTLIVSMWEKEDAGAD